MNVSKDEKIGVTQLSWQDHRVLYSAINQSFIINSSSNKLRTAMKDTDKSQQTELQVRSWKRVNPMLDKLLLIQSGDQGNDQMSLFYKLIRQSPPQSPKSSIVLQINEEPTSFDDFQLDSAPKSPRQDSVEVSQKALQRTADKNEVSQTVLNRKGCNCTQSKCQKRYCDCYKTGHACIKGLCACKECQNIEVKSIHQQLQIKWLKKIAMTNKGCNCKKSKCLKKYCQCYYNGRKCGPQCQCIACCNEEEEVDHGMQETMSKKRKVTILFGGNGCQ